MAERFDPYHKWLGIAADEQPANYYRLLGIRALESDPDVIASAADQRMVHVRSFQSGRYSELSQRILNELAAARVCLLNPERKATYDARLRAEQQGHPAGAPPLPVPGPVQPGRELPGLPVVVAPAASTPRRKRPDWHVPAAIAAAAVAFAVGLFALFNVGTNRRHDVPKLPDRGAAIGETADRNQEIVHEGRRWRLDDAHHGAAPDDVAFNGVAPDAAAPDRARPDHTAPDVSVPLPDDRGHATEVQDGDAKPLPIFSDQAMDELRAKMTYGSTVDVLKNINVQRQRVVGDWKQGRAGLTGTCRYAKHAALAFAYAPAGSYELYMEFTRHGGRDDVVVFLPVGSTACRLSVSALHGQVSSIGKLGGPELPGNAPSRRPGTLKNDHRYVMVITILVKDQWATIDVTLDGEPYLRWTGRQASISPPPDWRLPDKKHLGVGMWNTTVTFHDVRVWPIAQWKH